MAMMKAVRMHAFGDVDVLRYEEVEQPRPQDGEVLVRVHAAGVNPVDWGARTYPMPSTTGAADVSLPYTLSWDLAGSVVALGTGVTRFAVGEAVYGMPCFPREAKAYSEYTAVPASDLARKPEQFTYQQAAATPMTTLTALAGAFRHRRTANRADHLHPRRSWRLVSVTKTRSLRSRMQGNSHVRF